MLPAALGGSDAACVWIDVEHQLSAARVLRRAVRRVAALAPRALAPHALDALAQQTLARIRVIRPRTGAALVAALRRVRGARLLVLDGAAAFRWPARCAPAAGDVLERDIVRYVRAAADQQRAVVAVARRAAAPAPWRALVRVRVVLLPPSAAQPWRRARLAFAGEWRGAVPGAPLPPARESALLIDDSGLHFADELDAADAADAPRFDTGGSDVDLGDSAPLA